MVGGVGYAAGRHAANRSGAEQDQEQRLADLEAQQAAAPPPAPAAPAGGLSPTVVEQLKQLADLRDSGVLTSEEFDAQKTKLLGG